MKRLHVNLSVADLEASIRFYSALFAAEPTVTKDDYAKWMLDDPRVNFAISTHVGAGSGGGVDHLGIQVEDETELAEVYDRLQAAGGPTLDEGETTCCYARSTKQWISDPQGVAWETFLTHGESPVYGHEREAASEGSCGAACGSPAEPAADEAQTPAMACCGAPSVAAQPKEPAASSGCCG